LISTFHSTLSLLECGLKGEKRVQKRIVALTSFPTSLTTAYRKVYSTRRRNSDPPFLLFHSFCFVEMDGEGGGSSSSVLPSINSSFINTDLREGKGGRGGAFFFEKRKDRPAIDSFTGFILSSKAIIERKKKGELEEKRIPLIRELLRSPTCPGRGRNEREKKKELLRRGGVSCPSVYFLVHPNCLPSLIDPGQ